MAAAPGPELLAVRISRLPFCADAPDGYVSQYEKRRPLRNQNLNRTPSWVPRFGNVKVKPSDWLGEKLSFPRRRNGGAITRTTLFTLAKFVRFWMLNRDFHFGRPAPEIVHQFVSNRALPRIFPLRDGPSGSQPHAASPEHLQWSPAASVFWDTTTSRGLWCRPAILTSPLSPPRWSP